MYFFFRLSERKRYQKESTPSAPVVLLRSLFRLNGRLSEQSEFLCRLAKNMFGVAPERQRLTFFFWYLFFLCQDKKKSTSNERKSTSDKKKSTYINIHLPSSPPPRRRLSTRRW